MNHRPTSITWISLCFALVFALGACTQKESRRTEETKTPAASQTPEVKPPPDFGIYYESTGGLSDLQKKQTLAAANPSFLLYLDKVPNAEKLRLRFGKGSGGPFVFNAGTVTSSGSAERKSPPKPGNYQNILVLEYGEEAGVFEPKVTAVNGKGDLYRATYSGTLKPGEYMAFYFVDESEGEKRWEKARFQFAGQFTVK